MSEPNTTVGALKDVAGLYALGRGTLGWILTPAEAFWVRIGPAGALLRARGGGGFHEEAVEGEANTAFEARLFNETAEVRWWWDQSARCGRSVLVPSGGEGPPGAHAPNAETLAPVESHRILWGRIAELGPEPDPRDPWGRWVRLDDARVGPVWTPVRALPDGGPRLGMYGVLKIRERWDTDEHGNTFVVDEWHTGVELREGKGLALTEGSVTPTKEAPRGR
ncbi:MAG: hypothetical protein LBJ08_06175 [Bifidobacteriaceae bacterium]|jgi:CRISPR-associated protein (TIGR03984 family)|nr:hypothetical protein [Bifidobacteriaceae bacterium]